jgi:hypothetical protein
MINVWTRFARFWRIGLAAVIVATSLALPAAAADDGSDGNSTADRLGAMFYRSMTHWKYDYATLPDGKAGVACIPWERLDAAYLDSAIFEAFGFSYSVAKDEVAIRIATQGCNKMKAYYKLTDCNCELVLVGDALAVTVPKQVAE